ncbi:hypothetical protein E2562_031578 [Oryza meyeriana var. granulata]|uniref:Uncharacterized protein n=1 Tax=Oryza meyeriana var. granulata TaxID=110450 RepID=A0A6G1CIB3_9ORYZ|nr:hypothetical protein E2562_031578 [Oryza meyeriana var. granulata]
MVDADTALGYLPGAPSISRPAPPTVGPRKNQERNPLLRRRAAVREEGKKRRPRIPRSTRRRPWKMKRGGAVVIVPRRPPRLRSGRAGGACWLWLCGGKGHILT